jgi:hypothetical protein
MAVTIRNKDVEDRIRRIGATTGEGPSAVIARAVVDLEERLEAERTRKAEEKLARMRAVLAGFPKFTREEKDAVWEELERMNEEIFEDHGGHDRR